MPKIGAHMSIAKGLESAVKSSLKIQADTMQILSLIHILRVTHHIQTSLKINQHRI